MSGIPWEPETFSKHKEGISSAHNFQATALNLSPSIVSGPPSMHSLQSHAATLISGTTHLLWVTPTDKVLQDGCFPTIA